MPPASNKRVETRHDCIVPVESKETTNFDGTLTVDISRHGIGFISAHPHSLNEKIAIELQLKPDTDPILVIGTVKWVRRISDSEQYRVGLTYDQVVSGSPKRLDRYFQS